jgi:DNA-binding GntR family transcriptional regulator
VRDGIQQLILSGEYRPGQRLVQQELAGRFGVAQSVVRESLLELQFCGLVRAVDNLGMFVSGLDARTLLEAYEIRELFEGLAARLCCQGASRADLQELTELARRIQQCGAENDLERMSALDRQFHYRMVLASGNQLLAKLTEGYRVLGMFVRANREIAQVHGEHLQIVQAIELNQPEEAERLARQHVQAARQAIERQFAEGTFVAHAVGEAEEREKVTGTFCAKPGTDRRLVEGRSGKRCLSPFPKKKDNAS